MKNTKTGSFQFVSCLILIAPMLIGCRGKLSKEAKASAQIIAKVSAFRLLAAEDYLNALSKSASPDVKKKFDTFNEAMWPAIEPDQGWSYFFNTSLMTFGPDTINGRPVAFYHPWSDVYLITLWKTSKAGKPEMVDAELMMGDLFRQRGKKPETPEKIWMRSDMYLPAAIGLAAARSALSVEDAFKIDDVRRWRKSFTGMEDPAIVDAGRYGAGLLMLQNLKEIAAFPFGTTVNPVPDEIAAEILMTFADIHKGNMVPVIFDAAETLPETRKILSRMNDSEWSAFRLASFLSEGNRALVLLANAANPSLCMALVFEKKGKKAGLARIDLLDFHAFYSKASLKLLREDS
ncbi:MAG: hypothetical protein ABIJ56_06815 [Pseudomonadota bacterium]